ncbi:hypothetical protein HHX47_DHR9000104 [Lentinula edodes]|nr:hypothetical protein HHX47_DHR9000104 [Lentinula edodes]
MFSLTTAAVLSLIPSILGQTVWLAGDSTMAAGGDGAGWGQYLSQYLTLPVTNKAVAGTSARSFTALGLFASLIDEVGSGDYVGGGSTEVIHTFNYYITNAALSLTAKGAIPIISSQTPDNIWDGDVLAAPSRFVPYAQEVAGNNSLVYIDHYDYVAQAYEAIGETTVDTFYPVDHLHTSPTGANVVAEAFVRGLLCSESTLKNFVNSAGEAVPSEYSSKYIE